MLLKNTNAEKFFRVAETGFVQGQKNLGHPGILF